MALLWVRSVNPFYVIALGQPIKPIEIFAETH